MEDQQQVLRKTLRTTAFSGIRRARSELDQQRTGQAAETRVGGMFSWIAPDLDGIIDILVRGLAARLAYASFVYQHDGQGVVYSLGAPARHSLTYRIKSGANPLGEISVTREWPFSDGDICWLENRIGGLIHVLHDALSYRQAPVFSSGEAGVVHPAHLLPV